VEQLGKYQLVRKIATGGMAEVFLAKAAGPMGFQKTLVVKRILPHLADDQGFVQMFLAEAKIAAELNHPNVVQVFDFGQAGRHYYLAMEHIDGPNLRTVTLRSKQLGVPVSFAVAAKIVSYACEGLVFAHDFKDPETGAPLNLVHRDISPDNILVSRTGSVKVVDFGIARASTQPHLTKDGVIKGKMAYMAPEQLARQPLDRRVDVFALGVVFYELVSGEMPFDATSEVSIIQAIMSREPLLPVSSRRAEVPAEVGRIIGKALEKDRDARYQNCRELQADLERWLSALGEQVHPHHLADLVEKLDVPAVTEVGPAVLGPSAAFEDVGLAPTHISGRVESRVDVPRASTGEVVRKSRGPMVLVGVVLIGLVGAAAYVVLGRSGEVPKTVVEAERPAPAVVDAGAEAAVVDAGAAQFVVEVAPEADAGELRAKSVPVRPSKGRLELRVRPYAVVYLDGKLLGETPLAVQTVSAGRHTLRLVNEKLGKDVSVEVVVRGGEETLFKHNLKE
jgi:serine/threonine-protein kinase